MKNNKLQQPPLLATLMTVIGVSILCGLGTWQLQRLEWKQDLLSQIEAAYKGQNDTPADLVKDFSYGSVQGKFLAEKAFLIGPRTKDGKIGNDLITPLQLNNQTVLVNMGWTNAPLAEQPIYHLNGKTVRFEGLTRRPHWNSFTPDNNPAQNQWYKPDINEIATALDLQNPAGVIFYAESANYKFDAAFPNNTRQYPNNNHMQYALFWFAMAAALVVIYVLRFIIKRA